MRYGLELPIAKLSPQYKIHVTNQTQLFLLLQNAINRAVGVQAMDQTSASVVQTTLNCATVFAKASVKLNFMQDFGFLSIVCSIPFAVLYCGFFEKLCMSIG